MPTGTQTRKHTRTRARTDYSCPRTYAQDCNARTQVWSADRRRCPFEQVWHTERARATTLCISPNAAGALHLKRARELGQRVRGRRRREAGCFRRTYLHSPSTDTRLSLILIILVYYVFLNLEVADKVHCDGWAGAPQPSASSGGCRSTVQFDADVRCMRYDVAQRAGRR